MGGQGLMSNFNGTNNVATPNYGQQPMGANLGVSTADMGFGQAPSNPDLSKLNMTGMSYTNEQPIGGFAAPAYFPNPSYVAPTNNEQPVGDVFTTMQPPRTGDYGSGPMAMGNFGGINSLVNPSATQNQYTNNLNTAGTNFQSQYGTNPFVQAAQATTQGNIQGAQAATAANRVNQYTPFGSLEYNQTGTDQYGNPIYSATQTFAPEMQGALSGLQQNITRAAQTYVDPSQYTAQGFTGNLPTMQTAGQTEQLQRSLADQGMAGWDKATGLIMERLAPQLERQQKSLDTQLAQQGIMRGSEAYNQAQQDLAMKQNDLANQAALSGLQAQSQFFNQGLQAGQFGNQAITQQQQNQLANLGFTNLANQQGFQNQLAQQTLGNQAAQQNFTNQLAGANTPFTQLGAFRAATAPTYVTPYQQAAVSGPDLTGAYTSSEAARIAEMNAEAARQAALTGGLFQLGGSVLSNPTATGAIASGLGSIGSAIGSLF